MPAFQAADPVDGKLTGRQVVFLACVKKILHFGNSNHSAIVDGQSEQILCKDNFEF